MRSCRNSRNMLGGGCLVSIHNGEYAPRRDSCILVSPGAAEAQGMHYFATWIR